MRIDQIDIDIAGWPALSGSFRLPPRGVASWAAPSDSGKSSLVPLVAAALYGIPHDHPHLPPAGWLTVAVTMDDGERLTVARDLGTGMAQITDATGIDVSERWDEHDSPGEALLGFTHEQFLEVANLDTAALARTIGERSLRAMLARGRGAAATPAPAPSAAAAPHAPEAVTDPAPATPAAAPAASAPADDDLPIFRSAAEEMQWVSGASYSGDRVLSLDGDDDEPAPAPAAPEAAAAPAAPPPATEQEDEIHALGREYRAAREALAAKDAEYREFREHLDALRTEQERLHALDGAEPGDVERLERLVGELKGMTERIEAVRAEEARFREELARRDVAPESLRPLDAAFRTLTTEEREFLEEYRQQETILRGNQALTRSESRLDESRVQEIERARQDASRMALAPLAIATIGLFGYVALPWIPQVPVPPSALLSAGLLGAIAGGSLLWRARRLRHTELNEIAGTLERKREQLSRFDDEAQDAATRLEALAGSRQVADGATMLREYGHWQAHTGDLGELAGFEKRVRELEREKMEMREKLATFRVPEQDDGTEIDDARLDAMVNDYLRHFTIRDEILLADERANEFEEALADCEGVAAEARTRIEEILQEAGIEAGDDLDEAIAAYARRCAPAPEAIPAPAPRTAGTGLSWGEIDPDGPSDPSPAPPALADPAADPFPAFAASAAGAAGPAPEGPIDDDLDAADTAWTSPLSVRTEAILRRFLPGVRDVEVDARLGARLRLAPEMPLVDGPSFPGLGDASRDQVCLALRLAIVETLSDAGERIPVFLDDPFARADDARHQAALRFLVEDASERGQVVFLTSHEVRVRWFQHQYPQFRDRLVPMRAPAAPANGAPAGNGAAASHGAAASAEVSSSRPS